MTRYSSYLAAVSTINAGLLFAAGAQAGSWQSSAPFAAALKGDLYTPTAPAAAPAILVAIHMCTGHSTTVHGWFDAAADKNGFYIIAPDAGKNCFDSSASRSGDPAAIVTMVNYVIQNKNADKGRVFAAGMSSGGCMTNTLLAIYPDVFAGGSAMPGFPAGGWPAGDTSCTKCGSQPPSSDGKYWGDLARKAFAWSGTYPCSQQWVGGADEYNFDGWLPAVAAQFRNLGNLGSGSSAASGISGWTRTVYKDSAGNIRLETNLGPSNQKHDLETVGANLYSNVISFLGLDKPSGACGSGASAGGHSAGGGSGTGGSSNNSGGSNAGGSQSGGAASAAGGSSNGGALTTRGGSGSGGTTATAGAMASSGSPGTHASGGTVTGAGGVTSAGGASVGPGGMAGGAINSGAPGLAGAGAGEPPSDDANGCGCFLVGRSSPGSVTGLLTGAGLSALLARRRRARS